MAQSSLIISDSPFSFNFPATLSFSLTRMSRESNKFQGSSWLCCMAQLNKLRDTVERLREEKRKTWWELTSKRWRHGGQYNTIISGDATKESLRRCRTSDFLSSVDPFSRILCCSLSRRYSCPALSRCPVLRLLHRLYPMGTGMTGTNRRNSFYDCQNKSVRWFNELVSSALNRSYVTFAYNTTTLSFAKKSSRRTRKRFESIWIN